MNLSLFRHAFVLILVSLIASLFASKAAIPRLALSAHTIGMMSGILLIAIGSMWRQFRLTARQQAWLKWSWLYSSYVNWLGCMLGASLRAGKFTPIAAGGATGSQAAELTVSVLLASVGIVTFIAVGLSLYGLRSEAVGEQTRGAANA